jgi:hypothetical protein
MPDDFTNQEESAGVNGLTGSYLHCTLCYFTLTPDNFTCQGECWLSKEEILIKRLIQEISETRCCPIYF